jgi:hypothetical protein
MSGFYNSIDVYYYRVAMSLAKSFNILSWTVCNAPLPPDPSEPDTTICGNTIPCGPANAAATRYLKITRCYLKTR